MLTLQEQLDRLIQQNGEKDPLVQMLRNQIAAEKSFKKLRGYADLKILIKGLRPATQQLKKAA